MRNKTIFSCLLVLVGALALAGCTSSNDEPAKPSPAPAAENKPAPTPEPAEPAEGPPAVQAKVVSNVVELGAGDDMKFNANEIRVEGGKKVTVNLTHLGKLPAANMGHNFVLLKKGVDLQAFALRAMNAGETQYIPEGDEVIVHTKVLGGGESTSVTFDAPEPGTYEFLCTFPGHFAVMQGRFVVS